jgi:hypothetical protein
MDFEFNPDLFEMCSFLPAQNLVMFSFTFKQPFKSLKIELFTGKSNSFFNSAEFNFSNPLKTFSLAIPNNVTFINLISNSTIHTTLFPKIIKKESANLGMGNIFLDHLTQGKVSSSTISDFFTQS